MHIHVQAAAILMLASYENAQRDVGALLRYLCGFRTGDTFKWAVKVELHPADVSAQKTLRKVTEEGLFGYCLKQRFTSSVFRCFPPPVPCHQGMARADGIVAYARQCCHRPPTHAGFKSRTDADALSSLCRVIRLNIDDRTYDAYTAAYDIYRKKLTANRIALYASTLPELAMDYGRGVSPKYMVHQDTALRWMLQSGRYYLHGSLAAAGKAKFDAIALDMCAFPLRASVAAPSHVVARLHL